VNKIQIRKKLLKKLSQNTISTSKIIEEKNNYGLAPIPTFIASSAYTSLFSAFNVESVLIINKIVELLNKALHYSTFGKVNFEKLKNNNFSIDSSSLPSPDQKNLVNFSKNIFKYFLNSGNSFNKKLTSNQIKLFVNDLLFSQEISNLPVSGGLLSQKISGNLKTLIINLLTNLKTINLTET
jgi:hypothetical protein